MRSEGREIDIGQMMDRWTLQMGYPIVTISKNQSEQLPTHYITVSQEHFLYGQEVRKNIRLESSKFVKSKLCFPFVSLLSESYKIRHF